MRNIIIKEPIEQPLFIDSDRPPVSHESECKTAIFVCHGMGQQTPFETLGDVAEALIDESKKNVGTQASETVRFIKCKMGSSEVVLPRVEMTIETPNGKQQNIHLYEAYWAPLTENVISYSETAMFLLTSGIIGLKHSFQKNSFDRWKFGGPQKCDVKFGTRFALLLTVAIVAPVLLFAYAAGQIAAVKGVITLLPSGKLALLLAAAAVIVGYKVKTWVTQYMGDVAIYVTSNTVNKFWQTRDAIKKTCEQVATVIYRAKGEDRQKFAYDRVIIVGHSLGSVVAYDTLNSMLNQDQMSGESLSVQKRTPIFFTLGSPLDKTAFLFRVNAKSTDVREALAGAKQPLIQKNEYRPNNWINIYSKHDVISGQLDYYDDTNSLSNPKRVQNIIDDKAPSWPPTAHTGYWNRPKFKTIIYEAVMGMRK